MAMIDKDKIVEALAGKISDEDAERIAGVLCAPVEQAAVLDGEANAAYEDGSEDSAQMTEEERAEKFVAGVFSGQPPMLVQLPARLFHAPCFSSYMRTRLGPDEANHVAAVLSDAQGAPVREVLVLAFALREAYGWQELDALVESAVFSRPEYAACKDVAVPLLERCMYGE